MEFHAIAHCEPLETHGGLRYEEEPLCHLNLTFDLIADIYISISTETFDIENIKYEKKLATVRFRYIL